jgi:hypothetical protein
MPRTGMSWNTGVISVDLPVPTPITLAVQCHANKSTQECLSHCQDRTCSHLRKMHGCFQHTSLCSVVRRGCVEKEPLRLDCLQLTSKLILVRS